MNTLRFLVEKWLAPAPTTPVRVTRFSCTSSDHRRHVRVEALRPEGSVVILFFRHGDGTWRVFPPDTERLAMRAYASAG
ncbi:hypothetical protein [Paraburkholderia sp. BL10I2N1]|uniref:hypothetical protein n=1 Tax=Paraburkholderia sp. BL10I2N1 TaxID=1938796 RepID=UPI00105B4532|nr:hypothetical protein [Paraburkholderia sp. BL10I2N1]TDN61935.1 hypothetical protein B0G77_5446 [Paraburkholderia sp. BL10I2N1]